MEKFLDVIALAYIQNIDNVRRSMNMSESDIDYRTNDSGVIEFIIPVRVIAEDKGRSAFVRRVPTLNLIEWAKKKGVDSSNNTIFAIQESIYQNGIKGKKFLETAKESSNEIAVELLSMNFSELLTEKIKDI